MTADQVRIEQVIGTGLAVAYRPRNPKMNAVVMALPPYASDELAAAWQARATAALDGYCQRCGNVADIPADQKTGPGPAYRPSRLAHDPCCPLGDARLISLERACAPGGLLAEPDVSDTAVALLWAHLQQLKYQDQEKTP